MKSFLSLSHLKETLTHWVNQYFKMTVPNQTSWGLMMDKLSADGQQAQRAAQDTVTYSYYPELFPKQFPSYLNYPSIINPAWTKIAIANGMQPKPVAPVINIHPYLDKAKSKLALVPSEPAVGPQHSATDKPMPAYRVIRDSEQLESPLPIITKPKI